MGLESIFISYSMVTKNLDPSDLLGSILYITRISKILLQTDDMTDHIDVRSVCPYIVVHSLSPIS